MKEIAIFLTLNSIIHLFAYAQYTATGPGDWEDSGIWSASPPSLLTGDCDNGDDYTISGNVTRNGNLSVQGGDASNSTFLDVSDGTFTIDGTLTTDFWSEVEVSSNDTMIINGDFSLQGGLFTIRPGAVVIVYNNLDIFLADLEIFGDLIVLGDFDMTLAAGTIRNTGDIVVLGDFNSGLSAIEILGSGDGSDNIYILSDTANVNIPVDFICGGSPCANNTGNYDDFVTYEGGTGLFDLVTELVNTNLCNTAISSVITDVACAGEANGSIDLSYSGYTTPVITWSSPLWTVDSVQEDVAFLFAGDYDVLVKQDLCEDSATFTVNDGAPDVATPLFTLGAVSTRCQGADTLIYEATAVNSTGITYSLDAASLAGGNSINISSGEVIFDANWSGTSTITATATGCNGPTTKDHIVTILIFPTVADPGDQSVCDSYTLPAITGTNLTGNEGYYSGPGGSGTAIGVGVAITSDSTIYIYDSTTTTPTCSSEEVFTVTVTTTPVVSNPGNQSVCDSYTLPAITGTNLTGNEGYYSGPGGSGTAIGVGASIASDSTIYIYDSTSTTPTCSSEEVFTVTVISTPVVSNPGNQSVCGSYTLPAITGTNLTGNEGYYSGPGGSGSAIAVGASIASDSTIYIYDSTTTTPTCSSEEVFTVTVTATPVVSNPGNQSVCGSYTLPAITGTNLTGNEGYYSGPGGSGTAIVVGASIASDSTIYIYDSTSTIPTCSSEEVFTVTVLTTPVVSNPGDQSVCGSYTLPAITGTNLTGNEGYYSGPGGSGTAIGVGASIASDSTIYIYDSTTTTPTCTSEEVFTVTVITTPVVSNPGNQSVCGSYTLPAITGTNLTGNEGYYSGPGGSGTAIVVGASIASDSTIYIYDSTTTTPTCSSEEVFTVTVISTPVVSNPGNQSVCGSYTLPAITGTNLTGNEGYYSGPGGSGSAIAVGASIASDSTIYIYDSTTTTPTCSSEEVFTVTVTATPVVSSPGNQSVCGSYTLPAITGTNLTGNEGYYSGPGGSGSAIAVGASIASDSTIYIYDSTSTIPSCSSEEVFTITINSTPIIIIDNNSPICPGVEVQLSATSAGAVSYQWSSNGAAIFSNDTISAPIASGVIDMEEFTVEVSNGVCTNSATTTVTVNTSSLTINAGSNGPICSDKDLYLTENGGAATSWSWTGPNNFSSVEQNPVLTSVTTLASGMYYLTATDGKCYNTDTVEVTVNIAHIDLGPDVGICEGDSHTFSISDDYLNYQWHDNSSLEYYTSSQSETVMLRVEDTNLCEAFDTVEIQVYTNPVLNLGNDTAICSETGYQLFPGDFAYYNWSTGATSGTLTIYPGKQIISLTVGDENGCEAYDVLEILECSKAILGEITNVFTPNDDGKHDLWIINGLEQFPDARIEVFDKWGRRVYFLDGGYSIDNAWNGTSKGKKLPMDNYYYIIDLYGNGDKLIKGNVTILK